VISHTEALDSMGWLDALINARHGERLTLKRPDARYGTEIDPAAIVRDVRSTAASADHWQTEALKWQALAQKLAGLTTPH